MSTEARTPQSRPVLQVGPLKPSLAKTLKDGYAAHVLPDKPAEFLAAHGDEIRAVVTSGRTGVDAGLMAALPNLARWCTSGSAMTRRMWTRRPREAFW